MPNFWSRGQTLSSPVPETERGQGQQTKSHHLPVLRVAHHGPEQVVHYTRSDKLPATVQQRPHQCTKYPTTTSTPSTSPVHHGPEKIVHYTRSDKLLLLYNSDLTNAPLETSPVHQLPYLPVQPYHYQYTRYLASTPGTSLVHQVPHWYTRYLASTPRTLAAHHLVSRVRAPWFSTISRAWSWALPKGTLTSSSCRFQL